MFSLLTSYVRKGVTEKALRIKKGRLEKLQRQSNVRLRAPYSHPLNIKDEVFQTTCAGYKKIDSVKIAVLSSINYLFRQESPHTYVYSTNSLKSRW